MIHINIFAGTYIILYPSNHSNSGSYDKMAKSNKIFLCLFICLASKGMIDNGRVAIEIILRRLHTIPNLSQLRFILLNYSTHLPIH